MEREYVRGNKKHWKEIYEWAFGRVPEENWNEEATCLVKDTCVMLKRSEGKLFVVDAKDEDDKVLYDVITTNPNWHEVKPWEEHYYPKPFDKVLGWNNNSPNARPDIFLFESNINGKTVYSCAKFSWDHIKPYNEKEYIERL